MSNRSVGTKAEQEFCNLLASKGFWVHNLAQNNAGQPADVIAVRNGYAYLIDVKDCATEKGFELSRIEPNQRSAMQMWETCNNSAGCFAIRYDKRWWMFWLGHLLALEERGHKRLTPEDILYDGTPLETWEKTHG